MINTVEVLFTFKTTQCIIMFPCAFSAVVSEKKYLLNGDFSPFILLSKLYGPFLWKSS